MAGIIEVGGEKFLSIPGIATLNVQQLRGVSHALHNDSPVLIVYTQESRAVHVYKEHHPSQYRGLADMFNLGTTPAPIIEKNKDE